MTGRFPASRPEGIDTPSEEFPIKRTSITLSEPIYETGLKIAAKRGFSHSFSAYVAWLIQRDAEGAVSREDFPPEKKPPGTARRKKGR